jgi:hypothetical protein
MRTIETTATIGSDGKLIIQLPPDIQPGEHRVVVVIEETGQVDGMTRQPLNFQAVDWPNWPADETFRREALYDEHGR